MPSIELIVAGDVVNNDIHPYLAETTTHTAGMDRRDRQARNARTASPSSPDTRFPDNDDGPQNIAETRQYLRDFIRLTRQPTRRANCLTR